MEPETTTPVYAVSVPMGGDFGEDTPHTILYATGEPEIIRRYALLGGESWYRERYGEHATLGLTPVDDVRLEAIITAPIPHPPLWHVMFLFPKPFADAMYIFDESEKHVREIGLHQYDARYERIRNVVEEYYAHERRGALATEPELPSPEHRLWITNLPVKHITEDLLLQKQRLYDQLRIERDMAEHIIRHTRRPVTDLEQRIDMLGEPSAKTP